MKKRMKPLIATAWAWKFPDIGYKTRADKWWLCRCAAPTRESAMKSKPTDDAVLVRVEIREVRPARRKQKRGGK